MQLRTASVIPVSTVTLLASAALASPYASSVVSYDAGSNANPLFTTATNALGSPERFTGELANFATAVSPFNPAFGTDELVAVGSGGHLALSFDQSITNDASHSFGIDFIIFGNAGFIDTSWSDSDPNNDGSGLVGNNPSMFGIGGEATIEVSVDGTAGSWVTAAVTTLDLFPTLGYADSSIPTDFAPGSIETDFTQAMDPSLALADLASLNYAQLVSLYNGSGGGIGIDIDATGLSSVNFVRISNNAGEAFEIDGISVVPAPAPIAVFGLSLIGMSTRRNRLRK